MSLALEHFKKIYKTANARNETSFLQNFVSYFHVVLYVRLFILSALILLTHL